MKTNNLFSKQYAGTVMTSCDNIIIPTGGNWFPNKSTRA